MANHRLGINFGGLQWLKKEFEEGACVPDIDTPCTAFFPRSHAVVHHCVVYVHKETYNNIIIFVFECLELLSYDRICKFVILFFSLQLCCWLCTHTTHSCRFIRVRSYIYFSQSLSVLCVHFQYSPPGSHCLKTFK